MYNILNLMIVLTIWSLKKSNIHCQFVYICLVGDFMTQVMLLPKNVFEQICEINVRRVVKKVTALI